MDSRFLLSHIRHYPLLQERSLDFARDDDTGIALSKHIRCTLREINPFFPTIISSAARNLPCTPRFLASFADGFPFSAITHTTLSLPARKIPRLRSGWRYGNGVFQTYPLYATWNKPIPHTVISSTARNLPCTLFFLAPFTDGFPFSAVSHTALYQCARKIPPLRSGWRYRNSAFQTYSLYATWNNPIPPYRHFEHSEKSSLHSALSCSFPRRIPLFRCLA